MGRCESCQSLFEVLPEDLEFLSRVSPKFHGIECPIPPPRRCPSCREALRMAWRNEKHLFLRQCDQTKERLVSIYPPGAEFPVYRHREWFKDHNDATSLGRAYDASRSILIQIGELIRAAPRFHVYNFQEELDINSQYTNCAGCNKNCYLVFASGWNEQVLYARYSNRNFNSVDLFFVEQSRNCYRSSDLTNCDTLFYSSQCQDCHDAWFLYDCRGCHDCIACAGLRKKSHCIFNEQFSPAEYKKRVRELPLHSRSGLEAIHEKFKGLCLRVPQRATHGEMNEKSTGDYLWNTKNCYRCFDARKAEDCRYCTFFAEGRDSMDIYCWGEMELCYQISGGGSYGEYHSAFTANSYGCKECFYCDHCVFCDHCFACVGLNRKSYCILNQEYSREDYEKLVQAIVQGMMRKSEWGEFLPASLSPFGYNHSAASDFYPLSRAQALARNFKWSDYEAPSGKGERVLLGNELPDSIEKVDQRVLESPIECAVTGKLFRLTKRELEFYRENNLPIPSIHPDERERALLRARNPRKLWDRSCDACGQTITSSYDPARSEKVYCEECYTRLVYGDLSG